MPGEHSEDARREIGEAMGEAEHADGVFEGPGAAPGLEGLHELRRDQVRLVHRGCLEDAPGPFGIAIEVSDARGQPFRVEQRMVLVKIIAGASKSLFRIGVQQRAVLRDHRLAALRILMGQGEEQVEDGTGRVRNPPHGPLEGLLVDEVRALPGHVVQAVERFLAGFLEVLVQRADVGTAMRTHPGNELVVGHASGMIPRRGGDVRAREGDSKPPSTGGWRRTGRAGRRGFPAAPGRNSPPAHTRDS